MNFDELCDEVREMCNLQQEQPITLKWIDNEGISDLCKYTFANINLGYVLQNNYFTGCDENTNGWLFNFGSLSFNFFNI